MESLANKFYVYSYSDSNGVFYIGRGAAKRMYDHIKDKKHYNRLFENRLNRLRCNNELPTITVVHGGLTNEEVCALETKLIKHYGRIGYERGGCLVNRTLGGECGLYGMTHSAETKAKMSEKAKLRTGNKNPRAKTWRVTSPAGLQFSTNDLIAFCKEHDIWYRGFTNCFRKSDGVLKSGKNVGWKLEELK